MIVAESPSRVEHVWTGDQVAWEMARGTPGAFGRKVSAPYVWIPLMLIFFFAFFDWRRPLRLVHLDLLVLLSFSASQFFFNRGQIDVSVPLIYPPLFYLLIRMLAVVFVPGLRERAGTLRPVVPVAWLVIALLFVVRFPGRAERDRLERDRRRLLGSDRRRPDRARRIALRQLPERRSLRRHLRPGRLLRLRPERARLPLEGNLGRPAGGPRGCDRLRPADDGGAVRPRPASAPRPRGHRAGGRARLRLGRLPLHALHAQHQRQRFARRRPACLHPAGGRVATRARDAAGAGDGDQVRPAVAGAAVRQLRPAAVTRRAAVLRRVRAADRCW